MKDSDTSKEFTLESLRERAKELDCLYHVDEILNNQRLSLPEIFREITRVIPLGWQFPEVCRARIVYDNCSYQTPGFAASSFIESADIKLNGKTVGTLEVVYLTEVPKSEDGYFLEKERKLIQTIADRIGKTLFQRHMEQVLQEWNAVKESSLAGRSSLQKEWQVIVELLRRTDPNMHLHVCRKMLNYLYLNGIKEADGVFWSCSLTDEPSGSGELNYPTEKVLLGNITCISDKTFELASKHLSDAEILIRLKKWIQERQAYALIKTVESLDVSLGEIVQAVRRYRLIMEESQGQSFYSPMEHWLKVALIRRFLSDKLEFIQMARPHVEIKDFYDIVVRLIFPDRSGGKIGGKGTGLFLATQIIKKAKANNPLLNGVKVPKTWCITTDELTEFLYYNNIEELNTQKYKDMAEIRMDYPNIIQTMKNAEFPEAIVKSLALALDDFGEQPIIVRSSSLLEDQTGAAFSGKYKSLFLANQGTKRQRLEALKEAIVEVYASVYSPDSIQYRAEKGFLDFHEEMGIMIQEVVGRKIGPYFLPAFSGVVFSNNEFRWSPRIKREDGLVRLVLGLGTRAVDRVSDDFPVLVSPGQPGLRVNSTADEIKRYSPKKADVINLEKNRFETIEISALLKEYGHLFPKLHQLVSVHKQDYVQKPLAYDIDFGRDELVVTFDGLVADTPFLKQISLLVNLLKERLGTPVDIEFASDGENFYLLQCRPQSYQEEYAPAPIPKDIEDKCIVFTANRYISNGYVPDITHIVYVDPLGYSQLEERIDLINVGKAIGLLNALLPKRRFVLMGPGRWGSRGDIKLGVQVSYADINNTAVLIEMAHRKTNYVPELSFGTHFFQDLVEANIRYLPLYPDDQNVIFNDLFIKKAKNLLKQLLPEYGYLENVIKVIDVPSLRKGNVLKIALNAELEEALGYFAPASSETATSFSPGKVLKPPKAADRQEYYTDDEFWRWRFYMAERIAGSMELSRFGVKAIYVFGSTSNGTAGPGSDIDLLIHWQGTPKQREELLHWLEGWSRCLSEMNYLKTGYSTEGLLDVHIVTDEDIAKKTSFAVKIGAITDPAHLLKAE